MRRLLLDKTLRLSLILLLPVFIIGCATGPFKSLGEKDSFVVLTEQYRSKAIGYEKAGQLQRALQSWKIVNGLRPEDEEVKKRIAYIEGQIQKNAENHFRRGLSYYQTNSIDEARREFLITLAYEPYHKKALDYLKYNLNEEVYVLYDVKKGDTLESIASKVFEDSEKDFLIAYFNDLDEDTRLKPGKSLKIPAIRPELTRRPLISKVEPGETIDIKKMLKKAVDLFKSKKYNEALSVAEEIILYDPVNSKINDLINASYYQMGKKLNREKKYQEALSMFNHLDPDYKDVQENIILVKNNLAERHYNRGIKYYIDEELDKAIKEWETTLSLNPGHPKAKNDIENARSLLKTLEGIK